LCTCVCVCVCVYLVKPLALLLLLLPLYLSLMRLLDVGRGQGVAAASSRLSVHEHYGMCNLWLYTSAARTPLLLLYRVFMSNWLVYAAIINEG